LRREKGKKKKREGGRTAPTRLLPAGKRIGKKGRKRGGTTSKEERKRKEDQGGL